MPVNTDQLYFTSCCEVTLEQKTTLAQMSQIATCFYKPFKPSLPKTIYEHPAEMAF